MALPASREQFKDYCLRALGHPVLEINVSDEQIDDRIDEALKYYYDYHFDGSEKIYYKHIITSNNFPDAVYDLKLEAGGSNYSNSDVLVFSSPGAGPGEDAAGLITTNSNGVITSVTLTNNGKHYAIAPNISVNTSTGSGASISCRLGGFIQMPENIMGAVNIFDISSALGTGSTSMFSITYQIALNDLWTFMSSSLVPYYMTMQHLRLMEQVLVGQQPLRYNRHRNELFIDMNWKKFVPGQFIVVEAYQIVDPNIYTDVWADRWLFKYTVQLIKRQWAGNLVKYSMLPLPGGLQFNGQQLYDQAQQEIEKLEEEMINNYSIPVLDMIG